MRTRATAPWIRFPVRLAEGGLRGIAGAIGTREHATKKVPAPTRADRHSRPSFTASYDPKDETLRVADEQESVEVCTAGAPALLRLRPDLGDVCLFRFRYQSRRT
jgi:hypothetical protein